MRHLSRLLAIVLNLTVLSGCVAYAPYREPYPAAYSTYGSYGYSYGYSAPVVPVPMYSGRWGHGRHHGGGWGHHGHHGHYDHH